MYVADHSHRRLDVHDIALFHQQLLRLGAYCLDDRVCEQLFPIQAGYAFVEVYAGWRRPSAENKRAGEANGRTRKARHGLQWLLEGDGSAATRACCETASEGSDGGLMTAGDHHCGREQSQQSMRTEAIRLLAVYIVATESASLHTNT